MPLRQRRYLPMIIIARFVITVAAVVKNRYPFTAPFFATLFTHGDWHYLCENLAARKGKNGITVLLAFIAETAGINE